MRSIWKLRCDCNSTVVRPRELAHCELLRYLGSRPSTLCCLLAFEFSNDVSNKPNLDFTLLENGSLDHASPIRSLPRSRLVVSKSWLLSMLTSAMCWWCVRTTRLDYVRPKARHREGRSQRTETSSVKSPRSLFGPRGLRISFIEHGRATLCKGRNSSGGGRRVGPKSVNVNGRKAKSPQIVSDTLYSNFWLHFEFFNLQFGWDNSFFNTT